MSIRIHKLAEELGLDNKEMMALLKERRIIAADVKSVSSTVDNISASALREEFAAKLREEGAVNRMEDDFYKKGTIVPKFVGA